MPAAIVTRATKGAALTHQEMDANLDNLKATADAGEAKALALEAENPDWKKHLPTRAEFEALAAARRDAFAGSGFIEWGKYHSATPNINQGLYPANAAWAGRENKLYMGRTVNSQAGDSKTDWPLVNVNGYRLKIYNVGVGSAVDGNSAVISLPPAPATAALLDRQDIVFQEVWHEDVSEKDFVYPLGGCQWGAASYTPPGGTAIPCVNGAFAGYDTYSLFGNWQNAGDLVGKGIVWSTMTDTQKKEFVSDPLNNCYLDGDKVIQVRYRVRVVEGLGSAWENVSKTYTGNMAYSISAAQYVKPKGAAVSVAADIADATAGDTGVYSNTAYTGITFYRQPGTWTLQNYPGDTAIAHSGRCFALPIPLVQRRNQGAYHPVWNPNGSAKCLNADNVTAKAWYETDRVYTSAADCFLYKSGGDIASGVSGRPDGLFYDEISERDLLDLRNSAHKVRDLKRALDREFFNLVAGKKRGWEPNIKGKNVTQQGVTYGASIAVDINDTEPKPLAGSILQHNGQRRIVTSVTQSGGLWNVFTDATINRIQGGDVQILYDAGFSSKTLLWCDVIGDPANYPAAWNNNGVPGFPLVVGEEGEGLIPDGTQKTFKMSRKCKTHLLALYSMDNGATWQASGYFPDATTNAYTASMPVNRLQIHFYETEASPFEPATNAEVLAHGNAWAGNRCRLTDFVIPFLVGKVPVADSGFSSLALPMKARVLDIQSNGADKLWTGDTLLGHEALPSVFPTTNPAAKVLPYLTRGNGKFFLQMLYKEMHHNGRSWGDDSKFNVVDNLSTDTDNNAELVRIGQKRLELPFYVGDGE